MSGQYLNRYNGTKIVGWMVLVAGKLNIQHGSMVLAKKINKFNVTWLFLFFSRFKFADEAFNCSDNPLYER